MSSAMDKTICSDTLSSQRHTSDVSAYDGRNPEDFQFKPQVGASYSLGLSSLRPIVISNLVLSILMIHDGAVYSLVTILTVSICK